MNFIHNWNYIKDRSVAMQHFVPHILYIHDFFLIICDSRLVEKVSYNFSLLGLNQFKEKGL